MEFVPLQWGKHSIDSQVAPYAFNCDTLVTHFSLHQFKIAIKNTCEILIHDIKCTLELHSTRLFSSYFANAFNSMSKRVIYQKLCTTNEFFCKLCPLFVHSMHLNLPCFIVIIIVKVMSQSSPLPWEPIKVIP